MHASGTQPPYPGLKVTFPSTFGVMTYPPRTSYGPRELTEYEFVWIIEGDGIELVRDNGRFQLRRGDVALLPPVKREWYRWSTTRNTKHAYLHFKVQAWPESLYPLMDSPLLRRADHHGMLTALLNHTIACAERGRRKECIATLAYLLYIFAIGDFDYEACSEVGLPEPVARVWAFIHTAPSIRAGDITLDELARIACVSPKHLCRLFRRFVGTSPVEALRLAQLNQAREMVVHSTRSVKEIAAACGYDNQLYFSSRFKKAFGVSPSRLRELMTTHQTHQLPLFTRR